MCIPAYKRTIYLKRLLDSVSIQSFRNFEVIVTDDSPGEEVMQLCKKYNKQFSIRFFKNPTNLNTPENWNEAIRQAKGQWIKLMHDDDWFSNENSLQQFADAINKFPNCTFFFSAYTNVYENERREKKMFLNDFRKKELLKEPNILIADNVIGPPSVTLHKNDHSVWYDRRMKYVVDIDFYIQYLRKTKFCYINQSLINVGINSAQVTKYTFNVPEVHLKESLLLLEKTGPQPLKNIIVFDGWWRLIRNFSIKSVEQIRAHGYRGDVPAIILSIITFQKKFPASLLKKGVFSKAFMSICYLRNRKGGN